MLRILIVTVEQDSSQNPGHARDTHFGILAQQWVSKPCPEMIGYDGTMPCKPKLSFMDWPGDHGGELQALGRGVAPSNTALCCPKHQGLESG